MADIEIENLSFTYGGQSNPSLDNINLSIKQGEFILVAGPTACGKTTLLKMMKKQLAPNGNKTGSVKFGGFDIENLSDRDSVSKIGYVMQNPHNQIVTDKVWHELAFGLENIGEHPDVINRKLAEISQYFAINEWYSKSTDSLSSGQKQILNLASIMVMDTEVLLLDEPTSQLDPVTAKEFLQRLHEINRDFGVTVVLVEHDTEYVFSLADKVVMLNCGRVETCDSPKRIGEYFKNHSDNPMRLALPTAAKVFAACDGDGDCPIDVKEGREYIRDYCESIHNVKLQTTYSSTIQNNKNVSEDKKTCALTANNVYFRYEKNSRDILSGVSLSAYAGEILCILGGNGSGKTTLLNVLARISKKYSGSVKVFGKDINSYKRLYGETLSLLPQNPQIVFTHDTVQSELLESVDCKDKTEREERVQNVCHELGIIDTLKFHPYDLSGGQQQKVAIAKVLLKGSKILLLDEATKGLDAYSKETLKHILFDIKNSGKCVILVTHDLEFAADVADKCAMLFNGKIQALDIPKNFFDGNNFYTTAANKMSKNIFNGVITTDDLITTLQGFKES